MLSLLKMKETQPVGFLTICFEKLIYLLLSIVTVSLRICNVPSSDFVETLDLDRLHFVLESFDFLDNVVD